MEKYSLLYLSRADVEAAALEMPAIITLLEGAYLEKWRGRVESPPKQGIHPTANAFIHAMPAFIPALRSAGVKWVSAFPENPGRGLPNISGLIILNDADTGLPQAVMDCTWITAQRTGAKTAIAAKYLARPDSSTVAIIACGQQGRTNLAALACVFPIRRVIAYDTDRAALERYIEEMGALFEFEFASADDVRAAVAENDLVVTSGPIIKAPQPVIDSGWLKAGSFASAVDYASYWTPAAIAQMDRFCTDDLAQFRNHRQQGYFKGVIDPSVELGELLIDAAKGRTDEQQRTLVMNLGLAMDDMAVAPEVYRRAKRMGLGTWLEL